MNHWESYWSSTKYSPLVINPDPSLYGGTCIEPLASIGMSCFLDAIKDKFKENFSVLDYGCGAGILANFISERLENFTYYGLEPNTDHGISRLELGRKFFNNSNVNFGIIENDLLEICKKQIDSVILISVFTHMEFSDVESALDRISTVFNNNPECAIVFSCFIEDAPRLVNHLPNIWERFYGESYITVQQLESYCKRNNLKLEKHMDFIAMNNYNHQIYKVTKL